MNDIEIRSVTEIPDVTQIEVVQQKTWGMDDIEVIPSRLLHALQFNGACLLGAFDGKRVVGFVLGVLGTVEGLNDRIDQIAAARLQMYSVIMGVLPEFQSQGIGYRLKLAQREFALRIGVRLITWTYDPLESRNAYLNLSKLGVVCHQYLRNYHGEMGGINIGLRTDRFYVEWWVTSNRVQNRVASSRGQLNLNAYLGAGAVLVNEAAVGEGGLPKPPSEFDRIGDRHVLVEIPSDIQIVKRHDMEVAKSWRQHTRDLFEFYFDNEYLVTDFIRHQEPDGRFRSFYALTRNEI